MSDPAAILGLILVVLLFNFTYPQNAVDLLTKAITYHSELPDGDRTRYDRLLLNVQAWFFLTDLIQFVATYFLGAFIGIFVLCFYLPNQWAWNLLAISIGVLAIALYVTMLMLDIRRASSFVEVDEWMSRKDWLLGRGPKPFDSHFPLRALVAMALATTSVLMSPFVIRFQETDALKYPPSILIGIAAVVIVAMYVLNHWGLHVYMPLSSVALLCKASRESAAARAGP